MLQDQDGKSFGLEQMKGSVTVVSFFFTRCPTICPRLMGQMAKLHKRYQRAKVPIRLLSITVDPNYDNASRLRDYGKRLRADFSRWHFLTGPQKKIYALAEGGFRTAVNTQKERLSVMELTHTEKLILVDQQGQIRGYYASSNLGLDEVFHRSIHVLRQRETRR
ncbi:MAG: SCO family protein [Myxococcales bacterium]|nr:SCO family protein [Myxococcales bacterium]